MPIQKIKSLIRRKKFTKALSEIEREILLHSECPHLWLLRGDLIQLLDHQSGPPLKEAAGSYFKALKLDPNNLEAFESLAHYFDSVEALPSKAKHYARMYLRKAGNTITEMKRIANP